jgi:hypothetical protein
MRAFISSVAAVKANTAMRAATEPVAFENT